MGRANNCTGSDTGRSLESHTAPVTPTNNGIAATIRHCGSARTSGSRLERSQDCIDGRALRRIALQAGKDDFFNPVRNGRRTIAQSGRLLVNDGPETLRRAGPVECFPAGNHLVEYGAEAEYIRPFVNGLAGCLLRRHVGDRAEDIPFDRQIRCGDQGRACVRRRTCCGSQPEPRVHLARPKSNTLATSSFLMMMLPGFRSR